MTLFESNSQYREKGTIWQVFSLLPLYAPLADGRMWKWFAINIPMDMGTGGVFTSDIDIIACLRDYPRSRALVYKTWEVKVSLLCKDGTARSLKAGKTKRTVTQLNAYRKFGSPDVSLLDIYLCEAGFISHNIFPPQVLEEPISNKLAVLRQGHFGYQLLPLELDQNLNGEVLGLVIPGAWKPLQSTFNLLPAIEGSSQQPFSRFTDRQEEFFEKAENRAKKHFNQIVFCRACRQLQMIRMKETHVCPSCQSDLVMQP